MKIRTNYSYQISGQENSYLQDGQGTNCRPAIGLVFSIFCIRPIIVVSIHISINIPIVMIEFDIT